MRTCEVVKSRAWAPSRRSGGSGGRARAVGEVELGQEEREGGPDQIFRSHTLLLLEATAGAAVYSKTSSRPNGLDSVGRDRGHVAAAVARRVVCPVPPARLSPLPPRSLLLLATPCGK